MAGWDPHECDESSLNMDTLTLDVSNWSSKSSGVHFHSTPENCLMRLGEYEVDLLNELGKGAFGTVYKGKHSQGQTVAVKKIKVQGDKEIADVMTEIKNFQNIKPHQNLVSMLNFHYMRNSFWLIMDYCDLGDMQQYFRENNPDFLTKIRFMLMSASAIEHMHGQEVPVIHRDIKPANIMLRKQNGQPVVKITDFGLAKIIDFESDFNKTILLETQAGTPGFMAPEFFAHQKYSKSVDIFALGLVFLAMVKFRKGQRDLVPLIGKCNIVSLSKFGFIPWKT